MVYEDNVNSWLLLHRRKDAISRFGGEGKVKVRDYVTRFPAEVDDRKAWTTTVRCVACNEDIEVVVLPRSDFELMDRRGQLMLLLASFGIVMFSLSLVIAGLSPLIYLSVIITVIGFGAILLKAIQISATLPVKSATAGHSVVSIENEDKYR